MTLRSPRMARCYGNLPKKRLQAGEQLEMLLTPCVSESGCSSELALIYNDRAVLENYHVSAVFKMMKDEGCNIVSGLKKDEYKYGRR